MFDFQLVSYSAIKIISFFIVVIKISFIFTLSLTNKNRKNEKLQTHRVHN